jgi:hypothetical protein
MKLNRVMAAAWLLTCLSLAQQPNSPNASMTVDGNDGAPFPIQINVRTNVASVFQMLGGTNCPFIIVASGNGNLVPGSAVYFGDLYDLPQFPAYQVCLNGLQDPTFRTDQTGVFAFQVVCPPVGTAPTGLPIGFKAAYQAAILDFFSIYGWSLTAATRVNVTQGPTVVNLQTGIGYYGNSGVVTVNMSTFGMVLPFYGVNHSTVHISGDGYMTFGGAQLPDFTATDYEMTTQSPRIAGFWTDLDQNGPAQIVRYTIDSNPPVGTTPFLLVEFINVGDAVAGYTHNFNWKIDTLGNVNIRYLANNNSIYDVLCGIGPGGNLNPQPSRNLSNWLAPNAHVGTVNESMYEWFGIVSLHLYYTLGFDNYYDLPSQTLHFLPTGPGTLPTATNQYTLY